MELKNKRKKKYSEKDNNYSESDPADAVNAENDIQIVNESDEHKYANSKSGSKAGSKTASKIDPNAEADEIQRKAKQTFIETDFLEKVIRYVKTDNLIRKEAAEYKEKMATLKDEKQELENFIIRYLDIQENNVININGSGKLTKYESVRKSGINKEIIQQSIYDQIKKDKVLTDETKIKELVNAMYEAMEGKREKKVKTVLKRTFIREKKEKEKPKPNKKIDKKVNDKVATNVKNNKNNNNNYDEEMDEEPKKIKKTKKN